MPDRYLWNGLRLMYPENWSVQEEEQTLNIESPSGAFLTITCPDDVTQAFDKMRKAMEDEYDEVETEPLSRIVGESLLEGITQRFVYLDLIVTSHIFTVETEEEDFAPLLVQIQGEDRDIEKNMPVFDAMLASLFQTDD